MAVGPDESRDHVRSGRREARDGVAVDPSGLVAPYEIPARDGLGQPLMLRLWSESGRIALHCVPSDGPVYVDVAHTGELRSFLSASAYRAALLAADPDFRQANGAADDWA
jgi:hypothetical protein